MADFFISHSHQDKAIARRTARRLGAYGISAWLDERELRLGESLGATLERRIRESKSVLVIATNAATRSKWVHREISFARRLDPSPPIWPLFVEDVTMHPILSDYVGLDVTDRCRFESAVLTIAEEVLGGTLPPPDEEWLSHTLSALAREEPALSLLIEDCLHAGGVLAQHRDSVTRVGFHDLDYALGALYDTASGTVREKVARTAASLFQSCGVGTYVIAAHAQNHPEHEILSAALAETLLDNTRDAAIHLLARTRPTDDRALAGFIARNGAALTADQKQSLVRLTIHPARGPLGFTVDAAFQALCMASHSEDLLGLWEWWINSGLFDGLTGHARQPAVLAGYLGVAPGDGETQTWRRISRCLVHHVGELARATDRAMIEAAVRHVMAAAERNSPFLEEMIQECADAPDSDAWQCWEDAEELSAYIQCFMYAASTDGDWTRALSDYQGMWQTRRERRQSLSG